jgi:hypothetical protein
MTPMTPMLHSLQLDLLARPSAAPLVGGPRPFHALPPRLRASLGLRRLSLENARADGANRRANDDVRHAA